MLVLTLSDTLCRDTLTNDPDSLFGLGLMAHAGLGGVPKDRLRTWQLWTDAAALGDADAAEFLSTRFPKVSGWGVYCCDFLLLPVTSYYFLLLPITSCCS